MQLLLSAQGFAEFRSRHFAARVFAAVACVAILGTTVWQVRLARGVAIAEARVQGANLAKSLAEQAAATLSGADILLDAVAEGWQTGTAAPDLFDHMQRALPGRFAGRSHVRALAAYGMDGQPLPAAMPNVAGIPAQLTAAELAFHRGHRSGTLSIAPAGSAGSIGSQQIAVSRRFDGAEGRPGGILLALVDETSLGDFYSSLRAGPSGVIGLMRQDGKILARGLDLGAEASESAVLHGYRQHGFAGNYDVVSPADGTRQLASLRPVDGYPLVAFVAFNEADVLSRWRLDALRAYGAAAVLCLSLGAAGWLLAGHIKRAETMLRTANAHLQRTAMLDPLTGIGNRRMFDSGLKREQRRAARTEHPLALLMLDVDHFKSFNDTYGHPVGDVCLQSIASTIGRLAQRPADLAARLGGEEFAILLPETDTAGAVAIAERAQDAIRQLRIPHRHGVDGIVTVSIGVAVVWPQRPDGGNADLVHLADASLYAAKAQGRNRACLSPLSAPPITPVAVKAWLTPPAARSGATH